MKSVLDLSHGFEIQKLREQKDLFTFYNVFQVKCYYCGKILVLSKRAFSLRINCKYFPEKICCGDKYSACFKTKQKEINEERARLGLSANKGKKKTQEEKEKRIKTMRERGRFLEASEKRKGKSYEEVFGEKIAKEARKKIREKRALQVGNKEPHLGKKHSEESKRKMSLSAIQRLISISTASSGLKVSHRLTGKYPRWYDNKNEYFESSLEYGAYIYLNLQKVFWEKNTSIILPYIDSEGKARNYFPDILVFEDKEKKKLSHIFEIKPYIYTINEENFYSKNVDIKMNTLKDFCKINNLLCSFITEKEINNLFYEKRIYLEKYTSCTKISNDCRRYLNGEKDSYQIYQENMSRKS